MHKIVSFIIIIYCFVPIAHGMEGGKSLKENARTIAENICRWQLHDIGKNHFQSYFELPKKPLSEEDKEEIVSGLSIPVEETYKDVLLKEIARQCYLRYGKIINIGVDLEYTVSVGEIIDAVNNQKPQFRHHFWRRLTMTPKKDALLLDRLAIGNLDGLPRLLGYKTEKNGELFKQPITMLSIAHNKINAVNKWSFSQCPLLERLDLSNNGISFIDPLALKGLENLTCLLLSNNRLREFNSSFLEATPCLKKIDLSGNFLTKVNKIEKEIRSKFPENHTITIILEPQRKVSKKREQNAGKK